MRNLQITSRKSGYIKLFGGWVLFASLTTLSILQIHAQSNTFSLPVATEIQIPAVQVRAEGPPSVSVQSIEQAGNTTAINKGTRPGSTLIEYFDSDGRLLFSSNVPAAADNRAPSLFRIVLPDGRIARMQITAAKRAPRSTSKKVDVATIDDFVYGEPHQIE